MTSRVCIGVITGVHGVRGAVRIKSFTQIATDIGFYSPVEDEAGGRRFSLRVTGEAKGQVLAALDGVTDRDVAMALKGTRLFVDRARLPRTAEDEYLHADLIGLAVESPDGRRLGRVTAVEDFGAGDLLDIALEPKGSLMVPFTRSAVPEVDLAGGRLVVVPPIYVAEGGADAADEVENG
jgi:16S rRNA processing protein RimM